MTERNIRYWLDRFWEDVVNLRFYMREHGRNDLDNKLLDVYRECSAVILEIEAGKEEWRLAQETKRHQSAATKREKDRSKQEDKAFALCQHVLSTEGYSAYIKKYPHDPFKVRAKYEPSLPPEAAQQTEPEYQPLETGEEADARDARERQAWDEHG